MKYGKAGVLFLAVAALLGLLFWQWAEGGNGKAIEKDSQEDAGSEGGFYVQLETGRQVTDSVEARIRGFWNQKDGRYYLFLPSAADQKEMRLYLEGADKFVLNGEEIRNGERIFLVPGEYSLLLGVTDRKAGKKDAERDNGAADAQKEEDTLVVMQSANLGSVFVETESGGIDYLMQDKENRESGEVLFLDADASVAYKGELDYMKGRGNSSWSEIKPAFRLKLKQRTDIYGLGAAKNWNMVPNAEDPAMLRNAVMYTWADLAGLAYSPGFCLVDWYINGDYRGTYQICESIEVGEERVAIADLEKETEAVNQTGNLAKFGRKEAVEDGTDVQRWYEVPKDPPDISGGYLLELEISDRYDEDEASCGFVTQRNQNVVLKSPKYASKAQLAYIDSLYRQMEDAIYSENGYNMTTGLHYSEYIDVESFAKKYLIEEISKNLDAASTSQYLYKPRNEVSRKIFAGPVWDYDKSLGNGGVRDNIYFLNEPQDLYAAAAPGKGSLWKGLYGQPDYYEQMCRIFREDFLTALPDMNRYIDTVQEEILDSAMMNAYRWDVFAQESGIEGKRREFTAAVEEMQRFMNERCEWLEGYWD